MTTGVGGSTFTPPSLLGLVAWYRADKGITIATGVHTWADQSGTGDSNKNLIQATGSAQPTLNATDAAFNNQATLSFVSASSQYLQSATWASSLSQPATIFVVGSDDGSASIEVYVDGTGATQRMVIEKDNATQYQWYAGTAQNKTLTTGAKAVLAGMFNNTTSFAYYSAKTPVLSNSTFGTEPIIGLTVGAAYNGSNPLNGKIAEVIIYNSNLSATNINQVLAYVGTRYNITIGA